MKASDRGNPVAKGNRPPNRYVRAVEEKDSAPEPVRVQQAVAEQSSSEEDTDVYPSQEFLPGDSR